MSFQGTASENHLTTPNNDDTSAAKKLISSTDDVSETNLKPVIKPDTASTSQKSDAI
jgi:hypothetical protein